MDNIICIDPSLSCTAVVVNDYKAVFTTEKTAYTKNMKFNKWFEVTNSHVEVSCHNFPDYKKMSFAESEMSKFHSYDQITDEIVGFIMETLESARTQELPTKVFIEGYSFSSASGPLIDLVTFGTLLRLKLIRKVSSNITIIPPSELKLYAAKLTYQPVKEGKKDVYRNREGVAGGKFKKHEMYKALIENDALQCNWVKMLREHWSDIMGAKAVPKPIEDLNDAKLMYEIVKSNKYI